MTDEQLVENALEAGRRMAAYPHSGYRVDFFTDASAAFRRLVARAEAAEARAAEVQSLLDDANTAYMTLTGEHARNCNWRDAAESERDEARARAETAEARERQLGALLDAARGQANEAQAEAWHEKARADRLAAALGFYADPANHALTLQDVARGRNPRVVDDGGHRARAALSGEDAPAKPCPASHGDQCCGFPDECERALAGTDPLAGEDA